MSRHYETELVKNCSIPMTDGVCLAADLYRPLTDQPVPTLVSLYPYHKDDDQGPGFFEGALGSLAQAGYACLLVDLRGTGGAGGTTDMLFPERERRDYYETVEWAAEQPWSDGNVGVWGISYGSIDSLLTAAQRPPHLRAVAAFHGAGDVWDNWLLLGGRLGLLQVLANWSAWMVGQNFMPPTYRDAEGRWLSVWREHLEGNQPYLVTILDRAMSGEVELQPDSVALDGIETPVYLWAGWHDLFPKAMVEAYQILNGPKKLTIGPWTHTMPDLGHEARIDYLHELQRWFDYWLRDEDTGIMDEPPVAIWVREADTWVYEEGFPPPEVEEVAFYLGPNGSLSESAPELAGTDVFTYDGTAGVCAHFWDLMGTVPGLPRDQRPDELKGVVYTSSPLAEEIEICGAPEVEVRYRSNVPDPLLVVKLCDVAPSGMSSLITSGWVDLDWGSTHPTNWGDVSPDGSTVHLKLIPTSYLIRAGHRLRAFVAASDFPRLLPSVGPGEAAVEWGDEQPSSVRLPLRPPRSEVRKPLFLTLPEASGGPGRAPMWRIEHNPLEGTITVRGEFALSLAVDGGEAPATVTYTHHYWATASQSGGVQCSAHAESEASWESAQEKIHLEAVMAFRPVGLDLSVVITLNGAPYWSKRWTRRWPANPRD